MVGTRHNIELHIEELMLDGFAPGDRYTVGKAVELELVRLLTEQGMPAPMTHDRNIARLDAGSLDVTPGSQPDAIGSQIAQAVYGGLK
jgi:hypothetical protein